MPKLIPQPGEFWLHPHGGFVLILRRWNERECVCEDIGGQRRLLMDELMSGRVLIVEEAAALEKKLQEKSLQT